MCLSADNLIDLTDYHQNSAFIMLNVVANIGDRLWIELLRMLIKYFQSLHQHPAPVLPLLVY